jgi:hypothetical protein
MNIPYVVGVTILAAFLGSQLGGIVEDIQWESGGKAMPNCEMMERENWKNHCFAINDTYYKTRALYQTMGGFAPLIVGAIIVMRLIK